jgi:hypothetical protein
MRNRGFANGMGAAVIANLTHNNRVESDLGDAARPSAAHAELWVVLGRIGATNS